jgi:hypothetical protein
MMNPPTAVVPGNDGVRLVNGTRIQKGIHASRGRKVYPMEMREQVIEVWQIGGLAALDTPHYNELRSRHKFPHLDTCKRWIHLFQTEGHVLPMWAYR